MWYDFILFIHHVIWLIYSTLGMLYQSILLIGAIGLAAQAVLGFAHSGHGGHGNHNGDATPAPAAGVAHAHTAACAPSSTAPVHGAAAAGAHHAASPAAPMTQARGGRIGAARANTATTAQQKFTGALWTLFSPLTIFSFCVGMGATGLLLKAFLSGPWNALAAILGGVLFYRGIVRPIWNLIFQFASKPAETLSGSLATEAVAMSRFDTQGKGVVRVTVDGQLIRLLAFLDREDKANGVTVVPGDKLVVTGVDGQRNTCTVTRL